MKHTESNVIDLHKPDQQAERSSSEARSALDEIVRQGAQRMLQIALEQEVAAYIEACQHLRDERGHRLVVRNGYQTERQVLTGAGPLPVKKPRVHDRRQDKRFTSRILPRYMRRSDRCLDPGALSQERLDGRLHRSARGHTRGGGLGPLSGYHCPAQAGLDARIRSVEAA